MQGFSPARASSGTSCGASAPPSPDVEKGLHHATCAEDCVAVAERWTHHRRSAGAAAAPSRAGASEGAGAAPSRARRRRCGQGGAPRHPDAASRAALRPPIRGPSARASGSPACGPPSREHAGPPAAVRRAAGDQGAEAADSAIGAGVSSRPRAAQGRSPALPEKPCATGGARPRQSALEADTDVTVAQPFRAACRPVGYKPLGRDI